MPSGFSSVVPLGSEREVMAVSDMSNLRPMTTTPVSHIPSALVSLTKFESRGSASSTKRSIRSWAPEPSGME